ncbi:MAG: hypothetical protein GY780_00995 [bacterium]|nr:hypothetical protein [bacterium]
MKKFTNVSLIALSLVALFATSGFAAESMVDDYEFTAIDNDVTIEIDVPASHEDCNSYASLQNEIDLALDILNFDSEITAKECAHTDTQDEANAEKIYLVLENISFDG